MGAKIGVPLASRLSCPRCAPRRSWPALQMVGKAATHSAQIAGAAPQTSEWYIDVETTFAMVSFDATTRRVVWVILPVAW